MQIWTKIFLVHLNHFAFLFWKKIIFPRLWLTTREIGLVTQYCLLLLTFNIRV